MTSSSCQLFRALLLTALLANSISHGAQLPPSTGATESALNSGDPVRQSTTTGTVREAVHTQSPSTMSSRPARTTAASPKSTAASLPGRNNANNNAVNTDASPRGGADSGRHVEGTSSMAPAHTANECALAFTKWSPWTEKGENIKDNGCGPRRRTRRIRSESLAVECYGDDTELVEYKEFCNQLSKKETLASFQYYVIDRLFAFGPASLTTNSRGRSKRDFGSDLNFDFGTLLGLPYPRSQCPEDKLRRPVDFMIMLDRSGSLSDTHYRQLRNSMYNLINKGIPDKDIGTDTTRVALMTFAYNPRMEFDFNACEKKKCYRSKLRNGDLHTGGITRVGYALEKAATVFSEPNQGSRTCSRKVILLVTDGTAEDEATPPSIPANLLKNSMDVEIFVVGVTPLIKEAQLRAIASTPVITHLFYMPSVKVVKKVCRKLKPARNPEEDLFARST